MDEAMTPHNALRVLERQVTKARESVGMLDIKRAVSDPDVNKALDVLWEYVVKGGKS